jgi:hypothetical protein
VADVIADRKKTSGAVGIRIMLTKEANRAPELTLQLRAIPRLTSVARCDAEMFCARKGRSPHQ